MPIIARQAIIEPTAKLADDVQVGAFSYIGPDVELGSGCVVENNATIIGRTRMGENNHVFPMAVVGASDEDCQTPGELIIGEANSFREHVTICAGSDRPTVIGAGNLIMVDCQIGVGAALGDRCILANCTLVGAGAELADYVQTSSYTEIEPGVRVGAYSFVMGYSGVCRDAPPYAMLQGFPFRVRGVNTPKLQRCGFEDEDISALKVAFRELFNGSNEKPNPDVLLQLANNDQINSHVGRLVEFLQGVQESGERT